MNCSRLHKIRILHIISGISIGGAQRMLQKLLNAMDRRKYDQSVLSLTSTGPVGEEIAATGIPVVSLGARGYLGMLSGIPRLVRETDCFQPHIVHGWMYHGNLAATIAGRFSRCRPLAIWNVRNSLDDMNIYKPLTRLVIKGSAHFSAKPVAVLYNASNSARQHCAIGYSEENSRVIPNGFDCSRFRPDPEARCSIRRELGVSDTTVLIGLVARFHPQKDFSTFLHAAAALKQMRSDVRFVLVGDGCTEENEFFAALLPSLGLKESVYLLGARHDVNRIMCAFDIFSLSSKTEGFPNTLGEAMSCGLPCVSTRVGDAKWILGASGTVVPIGASEEMAAVWDRLFLVGAACRNKLGDIARERVLKFFSMDAVVSQYAALYDETMSKRPPN